MSSQCNPNRRYRSVEERLHCFVDRSGGPDACWPWTRCDDGYGYGVIRIGNVSYKAHRIAWEFEHGAFPEGMDACHTCDNPTCCNPRHIFPGTAKDNLRDAVRKGRAEHGSRHHNAKLTETDIPFIRGLMRDGVAIKQIARVYGVAPATIRDIRKGLTWVHV